MKWIETMVTSYGMRNAHSCTILYVNRIEHLPGTTQKKGDSDLTFPSIQHPSNSSHSIHWEQHSNTTWDLWWSVCDYQEENRLRHLWTIQLFLLIASVLCIEERWNIFANRPQFGTSKSHYDQTFRSTSNSRTSCRAVHRSFMWCDARPLCWIWWVTNHKIIVQLYDFPNTLQSIVTCHPTNGLDKFSPYFPWWHHLHPSAQNPTPHYPLHQWCTG